MNLRRSERKVLEAALGALERMDGDERFRDTRFGFDAARCASGSGIVEGY